MKIKKSKLFRQVELNSAARTSRAARKKIYADGHAEKMKQGPWKKK